MRNFWWYKNTTWLEDLVRLGPGRACVLLALKDEYCSIDNIISGVEEMNRDILEEAAGASERGEAKATGSDAAPAVAVAEMRHTVQLCQYPDTVHGQFLGHA